MKDRQLRIGDSVVVKSGVTDPDLGGDMGGWQGRITQTQTEDDGELYVTIEWDSIILKNLPDQVIFQCEIQGLDCTLMNLLANEVEPSQPRDTQSDVVQAQAGIQAKSEWLSIADDAAQGRRIQAVVESADQAGMMGVLEAWDNHLKTHLKFPFEAEVQEADFGSPLRVGERVKVLDFIHLDDSYGTIVRVKYRNRQYDLPLCDLIPVNKKTANFQHSHDYNVWFANR